MARYAGYAHFPKRFFLCPILAVSRLQTKKRIPLVGGVLRREEYLAADILFVQWRGSQPEHPAGVLLFERAEEILAACFRALDDDHSEPTEIPISLTLFGVVVFGVAFEFPHDGWLAVSNIPDFRFLDFEEKVKRALLVREREEGVGMDSPLEVGLLPVEFEGKCFERDMEERDFEFVVEGADRVVIEGLAFRDPRAFVREAVNVGRPAALAVGLDIAYAVEEAFRK